MVLGMILAQALVASLLLALEPVYLFLCFELLAIYVVGSWALPRRLDRHPDLSDVVRSRLGDLSGSLPDLLEQSIARVEVERLTDFLFIVDEETSWRDASADDPSDH